MWEKLFDYEIIPSKDEKGNILLNISIWFIIQYRGDYMTLGKLLKWISVVLSNFIVIFLLGKFLSDYAVTGFVLGVLWMYIAINIIGDRIPRDKLDEWKKFKNNK